jgi:hypothetical protein
MSSNVILIFKLCSQFLKINYKQEFKELGPHLFCLSFISFAKRTKQDIFKLAKNLKCIRILIIQVGPFTRQINRL